MTIFRIIDPNTKRCIAELSGNIRHVKMWLNPDHPSSATVNGTVASDGHGHRFRVEREERRP
jgi:hypothetical protein